MEEVNIPDTAVEQFLADLKTIKAHENQVAVPRENVASKENLEDFILKNGSEVIGHAIDMLKTYETTVQTIQGAEEIAAYSELLNASTNAIETLNKILLQNKKADAAVAIKKMDAETKKELQSNDHQMKLFASREEILKMMITAKEENSTIDVKAEVIH